MDDITQTTMVLEPTRPAEPDQASVDWPAIEAECRAGGKPIRAIARAHGISHTAVNRRAKDGGWFGAAREPPARHGGVTVTSPPLTSAQQALADKYIAESKARQQEREREAAREVAKPEEQDREDWYEWNPEENESILIMEQRAIAVYRNPMNGIVIREERSCGGDEDNFVVVQLHYVGRLIARLQQLKEEVVRERGGS